MNQTKIQDFLTKNISQLKNVGPKTKILLKRKKIDRVIDLLWTIPKGFTDRRKIKKVITGLKKASKSHLGQAKTLTTVLKKKKKK